MTKILLALESSKILLALESSIDELLPLINEQSWRDTDIVIVPDDLFDEACDIIKRNLPPGKQMFKIEKLSEVEK